MDGLEWDVVRDEFAFDGSWRDIYVLGTDMTAWQRMLNRLRVAGYEVAYFRNGQATELPGDAIQAFPLAGECDRLLSVQFAGVTANCHFFTLEEIAWCPGAIERKTPVFYNSCKPLTTYETDRSQHCHG